MKPIERNWSKQPVNLVVFEQLKRPHRLAAMGVSEDDLRRFARRVRIVDDECWTWMGAKSGNLGYGVFYVCEGRNVPSHQFSYRLFCGPVPDGLELDHLCRKPLCCNPLHLEAVTHAENCLRGVGPTALNAKKSRCVRGHLFDSGNTHIPKGGGRKCKRCHADRMKRFYRKHRKSVLAVQAKYRNRLRESQ